MIRAIRRWWWRRQYVQHFMGCRACLLAAHSEDVESRYMCEEGRLLLELAAVLNRRSEPGDQSERRDR